MTAALTRYRVRLNVWDIYETYIDAVSEDDAIGQAEELFFTEFEERFEYRADGIEGEAVAVPRLDGGVR